MLTLVRPGYEFIFASTDQDYVEAQELDLVTLIRNIWTQEKRAFWLRRKHQAA